MTGDLQKALEIFFPTSGVVEVRALTDHAIHSGYFNDSTTLAEKVGVLDSHADVQGIYITLNDVDPALLSRRANRIKMNLGRKDATTSDADIVRRSWLPVDLDPVRPSGVSSTNEEHQASLERAGHVASWLAEHGFPEPVKADSGNGAHLLYHIDLPNDDAATDMVKSCLSVLDALFSDSRVTIDSANSNAARIWKLYGTTSRKGDNTSERPHRKARILLAPDKIQTVDRDLLQQLAGMLPTEAPPQGKSSKPPVLDLRTWLPEHGLSIRSEKPWQGGTLFVLDECPFSGSHQEGAFAIQFSNGAVFAGCHHSSCGGGRQRWKELRQRFEQRRTMVAGCKRENSSLFPQIASPSPQISYSAYHDQAKNILQSGNPLKFMLDVFNREHVGDRTVAECLIMSVASQSVANTNGLHVAISGNSGKGKTHACNAMLSLLPEQFRLKGTVSNKALFYHPLHPGTVLLFDDVSLSEDLQEVLKASTANFREPVEHRTLTTDRQVRVCTIPERCVWWLAKVESPGDDQVMNRMLSVWIDDSLSQDRAVLEHMKEAAAKVATGGSEDQDLLFCRAMWEILKEQIFHVRIPFATRIHFSATHNRRNPGMLFDLIRCHAILFFLQRECDENGNLVAIRDDFEYARTLFLSIASNGGGQETKQTKNEAAALETMERMGLELFTIKQLQEALGLSYHQTYRLLHGYSSRKGSYPGILDKCPAVSYIDATVAEELYGVELKRREHYFAFDIVHYRVWSRNAEIWLEESEENQDDTKHNENGHQGEYGPDVSSFKANFSSFANYSTNQKNDIIPGNVCESHENREILKSKNGSLPTKLVTGKSSSSPNSAANSDSGKLSKVNESRDVQNSSHLCNYILNHSPFKTQSGCNVLKRDKNAVKKDSRSIQPLPGLLDHRDFFRVSNDLGRCDICNSAKVAYRYVEGHVNVCEDCYVKMVREWNIENRME